MVVWGASCSHPAILMSCAGPGRIFSTNQKSKKKCKHLIGHELGNQGQNAETVQYRGRKLSVTRFPYMSLHLAGYIWVLVEDGTNRSLLGG